MKSDGEADNGDPLPQSSRCEGDGGRRDKVDPKIERPSWDGNRNPDPPSPPPPAKVRNGAADETAHMRRVLGRIQRQKHGHYCSREEGCDQVEIGGDMIGYDSPSRGSGSLAGFYPMHADDEDDDGGLEIHQIAPTLGLEDTTWFRETSRRRCCFWRCRKRCRALCCAHGGGRSCGGGDSVEEDIDDIARERPTNEMLLVSFIYDVHPNAKELRSRRRAHGSPDGARRGEGRGGPVNGGASSTTSWIPPSLHCPAPFVFVVDPLLLAHSASPNLVVDPKRNRPARIDSSSFRPSLSERGGLSNGSAVMTR